MKITLYFIGWNDSFYLPFIKQHYESFCQRIVYYDNHSTDNSVELAKELGFEVRTFGYSGMLDDQAYLEVKNNCWKEERGKGVRYVIVCDADEFVQPDLLQGTAPVVTGYNIISEDLPKGNSIFELNMGDRSESYSKQAIFSPDHISEINFRHGCHVNAKEGYITTDGHCRLFHFRQIGGVQRLLDRHAAYRPRLSKFNLMHGMAWHYGRPEWNAEKLAEFEQSKRDEWDTLKSQAKKLW